MKNLNVEIAAFQGQNATEAAAALVALLATKNIKAVAVTKATPDFHWFTNNTDVTVVMVAEAKADRAQAIAYGQ